MAKEKNIGWVEIDEVENEKMKKVVQKENPEDKSSKSNQSKKQKKEADENYTAEQIKILKDLEAVRKRPAMYIGSTGPQGLHHLIWEIVDNSVDEALAGYCDKIQVRILEDGSCEVEDNGRGVPIDIHPETGTPALEVVFTKLHAGGKFEKGVYKVSGGLHGVGASVVNALSEKLEVWVKRDGKYVYQKFSRGKPLGEMKILKESGVDETGTRVRFKPDPQIFETTEFSYEIVRNRLKEISYIIPKIKITIIDKRTDQKDSFQSDEGLEGFVKELSQNSNVLFKKPIVISGQKEDVKLESAMIYREEAEEIFYSFVNTIRTIDGGTHETGFKSALTKALNQFAPKVLKKDISFSGEDIRDGLVCAISIFIPDPQFEGQTKSKLGNTKVKNIVESISYDALTKFFEENPKIVEAIIKRVWQTHLEKEAEKKAKELVRKKAKEEIILPGKLADCQERDPERTELFLVEGESAGGSAKQARDRRFQAILPLKGKILNVEKASILKMLKHEEIQAIISAIGCGIGKECKPENSRYNKIIILSDADIDGSHIRTLILTFLWRYMGALIEAGKVYIAQPPLYRVREKNQDVYIKDDQELREYIIRRGIRKLGLDESLVKSILKGDMNGLKGVNISTVEEKGKDGITIQRFKGLGEMTPEQLWTTTLNPSTRVLKVVTVKDAQKAEELFQTLMGEKVEPRREFIIKNALSATTLDI